MVGINWVYGIDGVNWVHRIHWVDRIRVRDVRVICSWAVGLAATELVTDASLVIVSGIDGVLSHPVDGLALVSSRPVLVPVAVCLATTVAWELTLHASTSETCFVLLC